MAKPKTFYGYFKENMEALGLPAPATLFGTVATATANIAAIVVAIETFGAEVTVAELVGAGVGAEYLLAVGACTAAFYVGACVGSFAVATGKSLSGGFDMFSCIEQYQIDFPRWLKSKILNNPVLNPTTRGPLVTAHSGLWYHYSRIG